MRLSCSTLLGIARLILLAFWMGGAHHRLYARWNILMRCDPLGPLVVLVRA